jgi:hypothetical protein
VALIDSQSIVYVISKVIYNLYFHPLAKFPGPKRAAISNLFYARHWYVILGHGLYLLTGSRAGGRWAYVLEDLHNKYGPVVRYAPDDLYVTSFTSQNRDPNTRQGLRNSTKLSRHTWTYQTGKTNLYQGPLLHFRRGFK